MKKFKSGHTLDRLSELPDSLILKILSSLEMRDVVGTTLLSKRWNNLWTTIPCLYFINDHFSHDNVEKIRNFINRALLLWKGTKIQKFKIRFWAWFDESLYRDVNLWLRFVTERKVEELYLRLPCYDTPLAIDPLPHCLYECSSIRKLCLVIGCNLRIRGHVHWDQLKSLTIKCFSVTEDVINRVVSGAPQLEIFELTIISGSNENLSIRSSSLQKLSIKKYFYSNMEFDPSMYAMLTIWAPNLEELVISGPPYSKCLLMDVSSLTDVILDFKDEWDVVLGGTLRQILPTFQHVERLTLSSWCFKLLQFMTADNYRFPPLLNVKLLRFTCELIKPNEIVGPLGIFPKGSLLLFPLLNNLILKQLLIEDSSQASLITSIEPNHGRQALFLRVWKMKKLKSGDAHTMDRLSELPDSLILKILSCLEMRDVVRTTLLSKRWNNLWTTIPSLCFSHYVTHDNVEKIRNFINRALLLWKGTKILKFKIIFRGNIDQSLYRDVNLWLRFVTEKKVEELYLCLLPYNDTSIPLPNCLYECSSIRKLLLFGGCNLHIRGDVHWDQLKSLTIKRCSVTEDVIGQVVSGAPQLEIFELTIRSESNENLSIRSSSLRKLYIRKRSYSGQYDPSKYTMLTIRAPNLQEFVLSGRPYSKCLMMDVSSLRGVNLDFSDEWDVVLGETLRQILPTFQHVKVVTLSSWCFKVLQFMTADNYRFPALLNVKLLRFSCDLIKPNEIVDLLEIFPKLNTLVILRTPVANPGFGENLLSKQDIGGPLKYEASIIKSLLMQLRTVEIGWDSLEDLIIRCVEFFLKHATMLEKIVIRKIGNKAVGSEDMFVAAEKLLSLQRSFPNVDLILSKKMIK